jgi:heme/copper-type cytochrome/quinol oxidase subunit 3
VPIINAAVGCCPALFFAGSIYIYTHSQNEIFKIKSAIYIMHFFEIFNSHNSTKFKEKNLQISSIDG